MAIYTKEQIINDLESTDLVIKKWLRLATLPGGYRKVYSTCAYCLNHECHTDVTLYHDMTVCPLRTCTGKSCIQIGYNNWGNAYHNYPTTTNRKLATLFLAEIYKVRTSLIKRLQRSINKVA